jgi:hypothetical protein
MTGVSDSIAVFSVGSIGILYLVCVLLFYCYVTNSYKTNKEGRKKQCHRSIVPSIHQSIDPSFQRPFHRSIHDAKECWQVHK